MQIQRSFFLRNPHEVAKDLLNCKITHQLANGTQISGFIMEVEVYEAFNDPSAHSYIGKTERNKALFMEGGHLYLHKIHSHICMDIVTESANIPSSVLIRSLKPLDGIELMQKNRKQNNIRNLTSGPGKLTEALGITTDLNMTDLCSRNSSIQISYHKKLVHKIHNTTRVGISKATNMKNRYYVEGSEFVSKL